MIRSFLDAFSGHLSPETWSWLDTRLADDVLRDPASEATAAIAGGRTRHGWLVYAPEDRADNLPPDLATVLAKARDHGAEFVLFDCDALAIDELPLLHPDFLD